ncbi:MAG: hypothetical protein IMW89_08055 [Ktedonobacteraceae bacterium]|nr:hypothetical protein [Ktedonobacteraceae bacterium]
MSTYTYRQILDQAEQLTEDEQLQLIEDLIARLRKKSQIKAVPRHNIMELKGLGKELWRSIDVDRYIAEERASWDG